MGSRHEAESSNWWSNTCPTQSLLRPLQYDLRHLVHQCLVGVRPSSTTTAALHFAMSIYEEVELEDMVYDALDYSYSSPCPCGDIFPITVEDLYDGTEDIAKCPSCTLRVRVIFDEEDLPDLPPEEESEEEAEESISAGISSLKVSS